MEEVKEAIFNEMKANNFPGLKKYLNPQIENLKLKYISMKLWNLKV